MVKISYRNLSAGDRVLFKLSGWNPQYSKPVEIKYVSEKYVVMLDINKQEERCVSLCPFEIGHSKNVAEFYKSTEL